VAVSAFLGVFLFILAPWAAAPAWAHPYLVQTQPGPGVALRDPPPLIQIGFTERVVLEGSSLRLDDGDGRPVALGPLHAPKEGPGLAADIKASGGSLSGDSSLAIETQVIGGKLMQVEYGLYTDGGALYSGDDKKTLTSAVRQHANLAESVNTREVAAARYAADGDLATARKQMVNATSNDYFLSFAARKKIWDKNLPALQALLHEKGSKVIPKMPNGQALQNLINGSVWNNAVDALNWGAANPEIRAGVLCLLSTIPQVTVAKSTVGGQPALTLTVGPALNYGGSQVLTINARTGMPISWVVKLPQLKTSVMTYQVSRVTLAGVKAGKF